MLVFKVQFLVMIFIAYLFADIPDLLNDIDGYTINLKELTTQKTVAVITMKTPDCPVCQTQASAHYAEF